MRNRDNPDYLDKLRQVMEALAAANVVLDEVHAERANRPASKDPAELRAEEKVWAELELQLRMVAAKLSSEL